MVDSRSARLTALETSLRAIASNSSQKSGSTLDRFKRSNLPDASGSGERINSSDGGPVFQRSPLRLGDFFIYRKLLMMHRKRLMMHDSILNLEK